MLSTGGTLRVDPASLFSPVVFYVAYVSETRHIILNPPKSPGKKRLGEDRRDDKWMKEIMLLFNFSSDLHIIATRWIHFSRYSSWYFRVDDRDDPWPIYRCNPAYWLILTTVLSLLSESARDQPSIYLLGEIFAQIAFIGRVVCSPCFRNNRFEIHSRVLGCASYPSISIRGTFAILWYYWYTVGFTLFFTPGTRHGWL